MIDFDSESLLCLLVVDDALAERIHRIPDANRAYARAFVLRHRSTGAVRALYRLRQLDGTSWYEIRDPNPEKLRQAIEKMFLAAFEMVMLDVKDPVSCFYPPVGASAEETIDFLLKQDLIEVKELTEIPQA